MSKTKKIGKKSGFSLVEIMVAILVLVVLLIGSIMGTYKVGAGINDQSSKRRAIDLAIERMELLKRTTYSIMRPGTANSPQYFVDQNGDDLVDGSELNNASTSETVGSFNMVTSITRFPPPDTVQSEYLLVAVAVTYNNYGQQVRIESLIVP